MKLTVAVQAIKRLAAKRIGMTEQLSSAAASLGQKLDAIAKDLDGEDDEIPPYAVACISRDQSQE